MRKYRLAMPLHREIFGLDDPKEIEEIRVQIRNWANLVISEKDKYVKMVDPNQAGSCYLLWAKEVIEQPKYLEMAESIRREGILVPLVMERKGGPWLYIWDGNRRVNMAKKIGMARMPAVFVESVEE